MNCMGTKEDLRILTMETKKTKAEEVEEMSKEAEEEEKWEEGVREKRKEWLWFVNAHAMDLTVV